MEKGKPTNEKIHQVRKHAKHGAKYINDAMEIEEKGKLSFFYNYINLIY